MRILDQLGQSQAHQAKTNGGWVTRKAGVGEWGRGGRYSRVALRHNGCNSVCERLLTFNLLTYL